MTDIENPLVVPNEGLESLEEEEEEEDSLENNFTYIGGTSDEEEATPPTAYQPFPMPDMSNITEDEEEEDVGEGKDEVLLPEDDDQPLFPEDYPNPMQEAKESYKRSCLKHRSLLKERKSLRGEDQEVKGEACYDPCTCPRRYTLPPTPIPSDHTFENLNEARRNWCRICFPKNLGRELTEDILLEVLIKKPGGDYEMLLPGNQVYPGFLRERITDKDMQVIATVLLEVRGISKLNLCYNEITDAGIATLAPTLQECGNINDIDLMHNNLTAAGILTLVKSLIQRGPLRSLKLTGMKIGDEGMRALTCLVLSGRCPSYLDIGDCDLGIKGFQGLCSALHAIENDIDYPDFLLLENNLPMDLVYLKNIKAAYNDEVSQISTLSRKVSLPTFVRVQGDPIADKLVPGHKDDIGESASVTSAGEEFTSFEVFECFTATILQGLFDLRHRFSEEDVESAMAVEIPPSSIDLIEQSKQELESHNILTDVDQISANYQKIRQGEPLEYDGDLDPHTIFLSRSLYSLDVVDMDTLLMDDGIDDDSDKPRPESMVDLHETLDHAPDTFTATTAATFVMREVIHTAASTASASNYNDKTDVTQLVLMYVLDTIEKIHQSPMQLTEDDCRRLLEDATEKVCNLLFPQVPEKCQLSKEEIQCFFNVLFAASQGTFRQLLENPYIAQALLDHGTAVCQERQKSGGRALRSRGGAMSEPQIRKIATSFLSGVIKEAARIVGVSRPFDSDEDVGSDLVATEVKIGGAVDSIFEAAGALAAATGQQGENMGEITDEYTKATDQFVMDLFEGVHQLVCDTEAKSLSMDTASTVGPVTYKHISRPSRLCFNRPIFGENSHILAAKIGDYLAKSTSVAAIHLRKWDLNEDGMLALMEPILTTNTSLVLVDLACNNLGADGIKLLSIYMTRNLNLKHLILNHNGIRDAGLAHINENITESNVETLDIAHNRMTYRQMDKLLAAVPNTKIRSLFLWGNYFGEDSWDMIRGLYEQGILHQGNTDIILQQATNQKMVVKNSQIRDTNEYYEVPAIAHSGLRVPAVYLIDDFRLPIPETLFDA